MLLLKVLWATFSKIYTCIITNMYYIEVLIKPFQIFTS